MHSSDGQGSPQSITDILQCVQKNGVKLWSENGQLRYKAPRGALNPEVIERLRVFKEEIAAHLERTAASRAYEPKLEPRRRSSRVPLTFSQQSHWHWYGLGERRTCRQLASAIRFRGPLNLGALQQSVSAIVMRHEALRTRIVVHDGVPLQEVCKLGNSEIEFVDLTALPDAAREAVVQHQIREFILRPIDVTADPLFAVRILKLGADEHVLIVAIEHLVSDGLSKSILVKDLLGAYVQTSKGHAISWPAISWQFADFAIWQWNMKKLWSETHGAYWDARLTSCRRVRFPSNNDLTTETCVGWGTIPIRIQRHLREQLCEWSRMRRTTLVMSVFTAYAALVSRWCDVSDVVIQYMTDGRFSPKLRSTIGYFAFPISLRIELLDDDSFVDLADRVMEEYCSANEHADFGYIEAQVPRPGFARNSTFNWQPQGLGPDMFEMDGSGDVAECSPVPFEHPIFSKLERDAEPAILLFDSGDEIVGHIAFSLARLSADSMRRFADNFMMFIGLLLTQPKQRVKDIVLARHDRSKHPIP